MGLIKAAAGTFGGTMADQWKEFFYCDAIDKDVLVVKGEKRVGVRSSNKKGSDNIISSGSGIAVADGQCMIIVEQGKVVEVCAEPGQFTYDASTEPSIFAGSLGEGIHRTFDTVKKRFTFGGDTGKDQRVYYFNTKELVDNKFGTANPIPFRVVDRNIGLDIDVSVRCNGVYSYKIVDPLLFYTNVCGNVEQQYDREEIEVQLKTEFVSALQPAFAKISELQIRPSAIPGHVLELCDAMNESLTKKRSCGCFHCHESCDSSGRGCTAYQRCTEECHSQRSDYGSSDTCRCSGRCNEISSLQHCRCYDRIYGNGHGRPGRWSEYAESLSDGGAAGSTEYAAGIRGRNMEM